MIGIRRESAMKRYFLYEIIASDINVGTSNEKYKQYSG